MTRRPIIIAAVAALCTLFTLSETQHEAEAKGPAQPNQTMTPLPPAGNADDAQHKGAEWLVKAQNKNGGWGAGSWGQGVSEAQADVATTALAVLALRRDAAGSSRHQEAIHRGVEFVVNAVETAPAGPRLNTPQGTQPQHKLGQLVDTHMASMLLGEVIGELPSGLNRRANVAYDTVLSKVVAAQQADGSFDSDGWAPVLSTSIASQSLNQAVLNGRDVDEDVLARADSYQVAITGGGSGTFDASAGAGVQLYAVAGSMRSNDLAEQRETQSGRAKGKAAKQAQESAAAATDAVTGDSSGALMAGFGSLGGEEMLSYMMISDTLAEKGGKKWDDWEGRIGNFLSSSQNADGSWAGHHCITSAVFVTAGAVMTLAADENPTRKKTRGGDRGESAQVDSTGDAWWMGAQGTR